MPIFIWSPHHQIGKDVQTYLNKIGFRFESRDELDYRILNTLSTMGYTIDHNSAHTAVNNCAKTPTQLTFTDLTHDKEKLLEEMFKHKGLASYVRCSTGIMDSLPRRGWSESKQMPKIFTGIVGYTNHQSTDGLNKSARTPDLPNQPRVQVANTNNLLALAEMFPKWKEV